MEGLVDDVFGRDRTKGGGDISPPAFAVVGGSGGCQPADAVGEDALDMGVVVDGERLVTGTKVEDFPFAALEGAAAAEDLSSFEPADEDQFVGCGDIEELAVHFGMWQFEGFVVEAGGDRVGRMDDPEAF